MESNDLEAGSIMSQAPESNSLQLGRRQFLQLAGTAGAALLLPAGVRPGGAGILGTAQPPIADFLTAGEYDIVRAATARIFPSDGTPGALEAAVADYVQGMLSQLPAADANCDGGRGAADFVAVSQAIQAGASSCPQADVNADGLYTEADLTSVQVSLFQARAVFAGGPHSGRQPFVDPQTLAPSDVYPANSFLNFVGLNRVQRIAWEARLNGTTDTPELAGNPLASGVRVNLRDQYRKGLAKLESQSLLSFGVGFVDLTPPQQSRVLAHPTVASFVRQLRAHTMEGMFSAPEYGGNRGRVGWTLIGYGGDSQPQGYTYGFDEETGMYVENPERPNSRPNPGEDCSGLTPKVLTLVKALVSMQPHFTEFPEPFCYGVEG